MTVCRGCCCGTAEKHPGVDHDGLVDRFRLALAGVAKLRVTDCLGACERSNVVVVGPSRLARAIGARPTWFSNVLDEDTVDDIVRWIHAGGPGFADHGTDLRRRLFAP